MRGFWVIVGLAALIPACGRQQTGQIHSRQLVPGTVSKLVVEVAYMEGAEPDTEPASDGRPIWDLVRNNLEALLEGSGISVETPTALSEMERIPALGQPAYSPEKLKDLASAYRRAHRWTPGGFSILVLFVDGKVGEEDQVRREPTGISIDGFRTVGIAKPVLRKKRSEASPGYGLLEQSVVLHEIGHALGLVNLGIPSAANHVDPAHPDHCKNPRCIMHYELSMASQPEDRVEDAVTSSILFDSGCLADARKFFRLSRR